MSRSNGGTVLGIEKKRPVRGQGRKSRLVVREKTGPAKAAKAGRAKPGPAKTDATKADSNPSLQTEWEEVSEDLDELPDIYSMLDKSAPERSCDTAVRRRIEMLREERQLQQALTEVFDF